MRRFVNHWHGATIERHSLSHARWACQLPQRGSRERHRPAGCHSTNRPITAAFRAIFIAPTKLRMFNRSHSSGDTPSEREPGTPSSGRMPFNVPLRNRNVAGDFHRPYGDSECLTVPIHWRKQKFLVFSYVSCVIRQIVVKWGKIYPAVPAGGG